MGKIFLVYSVEELNEFELSVREQFLSEYKHFFREFEQCGITLILQPCYYYRGKFHTKRKNKYCFLTYRMLLLPKGISLSQAKKIYLYKKFFSKKLVVMSKDSHGFKVKRYDANDCFLKYYINKTLVKAKKLKLLGLKSTDVLNESIIDVLWSVAFWHRYRTEIKHTIRGKNLEWIFLFFVFALICIHCYFRLKFLEQFG